MTTQHSIKTFQNDLLVETRLLDLATNTFTRRDAVSNILEQRPLTSREAEALNEKAADEARNAAFGQARADHAALPPTPLKSIIGNMLDELERLR